MSFPTFGADVSPIFVPRDDVGNKLLKVAGWQTMDLDLSEVVHASTSSEFDMYNFNIPANTLGTDRAVMAILEAYVFNNNAVNTITLRMRYGTDVAASVADSMAASTAWRIARCVALLKADGATGAQLARFSTPLESTDTILASFTQDSTTNKVLRITGQFDAASANLICRISLRRLYVLQDI